MTDEQDIREEIKHHSLSQSKTETTKVRGNVDSGENVSMTFNTHCQEKETIEEDTESKTNHKQKRS